MQVLWGFFSAKKTYTAAMGGILIALGSAMTGQMEPTEAHPAFPSPGRARPAPVNLVRIVPGNRNSGYQAEKCIFQRKLPLDEKSSEA